MEDTIHVILQEYGLNPDYFSFHQINSGHINYTYKVEGDEIFILQRINKEIFKHPEDIAENLRIASLHLSRHHPEYLFLNTLKTESGEEMAFDSDGFPWRLFPYIENTTTIDEVESETQAYHAAEAFGKLTRNLSTVDVRLFKETIPRFHDLTLRYSQFEDALRGSEKERRDSSGAVIKSYVNQNHLVEKYKQLIGSGELQLRIVHNDTKINNVLFDSQKDQVLCVIDLDTLMPGYFIYDLGDMVRTFVSPASEDEQDLSKVVVRKKIYDAILEGYLSQMEARLTASEKQTIDLAGPIMTYMIGLRFLTDYLNGDTYFHTAYPRQNLVRARNQMHLLELLLSATFSA